MKEKEKGQVLEVICNETDEILKNKLKKLLIEICYGKEKIGIITFEETIKELNQRISQKTDPQKAGMVGELLFHIKSYECFKDYNHISVYLNKEEKSVKKGFDVLLFDGKKVWYSEVKSMENAENIDITEAHIVKVKEAIIDITDKFNSNNNNYWLTAKTNIANIETKRLEKQIAEILTKDIEKNIQKNAITVSAVFKKCPCKIKKENIKNLINKKQKNFNTLTAVCISHSDYKKIINILKEIEKENET